MPTACTIQNAYGPKRSSDNQFLCCVAARQSRIFHGRAFGSRNFVTVSGKWVLVDVQHFGANGWKLQFAIMARVSEDMTAGCYRGGVTGN